VKANVLIVDDDSVCLSFLSGTFSRFADRFSVLTAHDGEAALNVLRREPVSLVVTDLLMPGMTGSDLLLRIVDEQPHIPRMVMTSLNTPMPQLPPGPADILEYFIKPISADRLADKILSVVESSREAGFLSGISVGSFVQLLDIERKTATIIVRDGDTAALGTLYFRNGRLLDGRLGGRGGLEAVCEILSWPEVTISLMDSCPRIPDVIGRKTQEVLLLVAQMMDENETLKRRGIERRKATQLSAPFYELKPTVATEQNEDDAQPRQEARDLQNRGFEAFNAGDYDEARRCWMELLLYTPESKTLEHNLRVVEERIKQPPDVT
jgi:CheY-like chemotaxis protein